jgi:hypothetical protein
MPPARLPQNFHKQAAALPALRCCRGKAGRHLFHGISVVSTAAYNQGFRTLVNASINTRGLSYVRPYTTHTIIATACPISNAMYNVAYGKQRIPLCQPESVLTRSSIAPTLERNRLHATIRAPGIRINGMKVLVRGTSGP